MSLWGNQETKGATGLIYIASSGTVTGYNTQFGATGSRVGDYIQVYGATGTHYMITTISSLTSATVRTGIPGGTVTALGATSAYTLSEKPCYVTASECDGSTGIHGDPTKVYGIDTAEMDVINSIAGATGNKGVQHAGWVRRIEGTGGRAGRVQHETLVAMGTITGDAPGDTKYPNS